MAKSPGYLFNEKTLCNFCNEGPMADHSMCIIAYQIKELREAVQKLTIVLASKQNN